MSILTRLFRSRDKPTDSLPGGSFSFLFGGSSSGKAVNERTAMQTTAVYSCVRILAETVASLPLHTYKYTAMQKALLLPSEKREYFVKFNVNGLLRGDYKSRMDGYSTGRQNGWLSANDIREMEDMDKIPVDEGGDLYLVNGNMIPLTGTNRREDIN